MYSRHRFPSEIIHQLLRLVLLHFPLSYRDIEKMMLYRGVKVTYESIRVKLQIKQLTKPKSNRH